MSGYHIIILDVILSWLLELKKSYYNCTAEPLPDYTFLHLLIPFRLFILGKCFLPIDSHSRIKCNHELGIFEWRAAKDHGGETHAETSMRVCSFPYSSSASSWLWMSNNPSWNMMLRDIYLIDYVFLTLCSHIIQLMF